VITVGYDWDKPRAPGDGSDYLPGKEVNFFYDPAIQAQRARRQREATAAREARIVVDEQVNRDADNASWAEVGNRYLNPLRSLSRALKRGAYKAAPK
jgi:hypothetical protein